MLQRPLIATDRYYSGQDKSKKDKQDESYSSLYNGIVTGQYSFEQIPAANITALEPNQINSLRAVSKSIYSKEVKTDPITLSMIMLNKDELLKGKPQSVLHQYADKLSPTDYKEVTKVYAEVNGLKDAKKKKKNIFGK